MIKVALIGIGGMGKCHFDVYQSLKNVELVAVADARTEMAKEKVANASVNIYSNMEDLVANENVDIVDICTPSYLHSQMIIYGLNHGLHVLCEKPMTLNSDDAAKVLDAASKTDKKFMVAHVVRFMKEYQYLKAAVDSKKYGKLLHLNMNRISLTPVWSWENWMLDPKRSGSVPMDLHIHDVDFMQYLLGEPDSMQCQYFPMKCDTDYITSSFHYGEAIVTIQATWYKSFTGFDANYRAVFELATIEGNGTEIVLHKDGVAEHISMDKVENDTGINISNLGGYQTEIEYFIDCVEQNKDPEIVTPESSAYSVKLIEDLLK